MYILSVAPKLSRLYEDELNYLLFQLTLQTITLQLSISANQRVPENPVLNLVIRRGFQSLQALNL